jgi:hypothetical protein
MSDETGEFSRLLDQLEAHPRALLRDLLDRERPLVAARAPGHLDVMGGIAECSGAISLGMPIAEVSYVAAQQSAVLGLRATPLRRAHAA